MVLSATNLYKAFGRKEVLRDLSLEVAPSTLCGIVGENGSGKSTLLKILVGEWKPGRGAVTTTGRIGYCPQRITLFPQLTVEEHFRYFGAAFGLSDPQRTAQQAHLSLALLHQP